MRRSHTLAAPASVPPAASLQLRLVRSHGSAADPALAVWPLVPGQSLSMATAFAASPVRLEPAQMQAAGLCQLRSAGAVPGGGTMWWLTNEGEELVCTVNERQLPPGQQLRVHEGDVIELGLLNFVVEAQGPARVQAEPAASPPASDQPSANAYADFQLADLLLIERTANPADAFTAKAALESGAPEAGTRLAGQGRASRQLIDAHDNPFNDVIDVSYRLDVASPGSPRAGDTAAATAGTGAAGQGTRLVTGLLDQRSQPAPDPSELDSADTDAANASEEPPAAQTEVMRHLHAEYLRLMRNPHEQAAEPDWSLRADSGGPSASKDLQQLTHDAARFESLYDILGQGANIETILRGLDTLSDTNLLAADPQVNVLRLFAPADLTMQETGLPGLTRREHHFLSADSAASLDRARPVMPRAAAPGSDASDLPDWFPPEPSFPNRPS